MTTSSPLLTPTPRLALPQSARPSHGAGGPRIETINGVLNLGKIGEARLDLIPDLSECHPGMKPTEYNVIIAAARAGATMGALGIIHRTDADRETEEMAMQVGRIVAMSPLAFNYDQWLDAEDSRPKVGDIVWFARYAGALIEAAFDGRQYRMVKDRDVAAIIIEPESVAGNPEQVFEIG